MNNNNGPSSIDNPSNSGCFEIISNIHGKKDYA
jgi:hypothetical protein